MDLAGERPDLAGRPGELMVTAALRPSRRLRFRVWDAARTSRSRTGALLGARAVEQGVLGGATLVLARWLGVDGFAPVAVLMVFNSLSVVASDHGVGTSILANPPGSVDQAQVSRVRLGNVGVATAVIVLGLIMGGDWATGAPLAAAIWWLSGEAFIRKAALITLGKVRRAAVMEASASVVLAITVALVAVLPQRGLVLVGLGLVAKHGLEVMGAGSWRTALGPGTTRSAAVWLTQVLAHAIANIDFLIVGLLISESAFAVYALAFRVSSAVGSQLTYVVGRVSLVDLAQADGDEARQQLYRSRLLLLFGCGVVAAAATIALAPLLPIALGDQWRPTVMVIVVLALALPWRMSLGASGALLLSHGKASKLARWEVSRLVASAVLLSAMALISFGAFVAAATLLAILGSVLFHIGGAKLTGLRPSGAATVAALPVATASVLLALVIGTP